MIPRKPAAQRCLSVVLAAFSLFVVAAADELAREHSRYMRTAFFAQAAEADVRAGFAATALGQLGTAYEEEAVLALEEAEAVSTPELSGWAAAVRRYARQFYRLIEEIGAGKPVRIVVESGQPVSLLVGERTVMLTHPRPSQQAALEQTIISEFCRQHDCELATDRLGTALAIPVSPGPVRPLWAFNTHGPVCSLRGLSVNFPQDSSMLKARPLCQQFMGEVFVLLNEIAWQVRHGVPVEWQDLRIFVTPQRPQNRLQLNTLGDSVLAAVPLLAERPGVIPKLANWMKDQIEGEGELKQSIDAREFGW